MSAAAAAALAAARPKGVEALRRWEYEKDAARGPNAEGYRWADLCGLEPFLTGLGGLGAEDFKGAGRFEYEGRLGVY